MPDKCMLFIDNIMELSRDSRLTREVPFFSLESYDCGIGAVAEDDRFSARIGTRKPAVSEQDAIQMMRQGFKRGVTGALATVCEVRYLAVVVLAVLTAACATLRPDSPNEEKVKVVTQRAEARWNAVIGKNFDAAYEYLSPSSRAALPLATFRAMASRIAYREIKVIAVSCEEQICRAKLMLTYDAVGHKGVSTPFDEDWIIEKGQAWYVWPN